MPRIPDSAWIVFGVTLLVLLAIDLFVHRGARGESRRWSVIWSIIWVAVGLAFAFFVWWAVNARAAQEYLAAYLIEKSLSLDNLFVFMIIFRSLQIPARYHRTALSWGIFGALVFRAIFIVLGAAAIQRWEWIAYVFGAILLIAAWRAFRENPQEQRESWLVEWLARRLPVTRTRDTAKFVVRDDRGRWHVTPLLIAVIGLEASDILFAIDSVPAALAVSREEFIVYSSNAFAILGLRSLYIVLAQTLADLRYLHYGLAAVLGFAALKMLTAHWIDIPPLLSVAVIVVMIGAAIGASVVGGKVESRK